MKTKILSLAIALMMLVSIVTVMPVGAVGYEGNDIILDVKTDIIQGSYDYTSNTFNYTPSSASSATWATKGVLNFPNKSSQNVTFKFNVTKAGTYRVLAATSDDQGRTSSMYATLVDAAGKTIETFCTKTVVHNGKETTKVAVTDLDYVTLTEGEQYLKIGRNSSGFLLWNVKLEYVSDELTVCSTGSMTIANPLVAAARDKKPADDLGWLPSYRVGVTKNTTLTKNARVVKDGYYDLYLGAIRYSSSAPVPTVSVNVDGEAVASGKTFTAGATASETLIAKTIYLEAGTTPITLTFNGTTSDGAYVYGFKLDYHGELTDEDCTVVSSVSSADIDVLVAQVQTDATQTDNFGWIPSKYTLLANSNSATHTVKILREGYYDIYLGLKDGDETSAVDIYVDTTEEISNCDTSNMEEGVTTQLNAGQLYLTAGEHAIKVANSSGNVWYYGFKLSPAQGGTTPEPLAEGITLVKNDGSAFTASDIASGASVKAKAVITMDAAADAYIIIAQYTDNSATKKMLGTVVMDAVSLASGDNDVTSTNALTLDAECGYVQAFLWTADNNYKPLLAGVSVSK